MMGIPPRTTFELAKEQLMIPMQGLLVPYLQVSDNLQRFCRPVAFYNANTPLELSISGSAFLFRQRGRNLLLCCNHQLTNHGRTAEELVVIVNNSDDTQRKGLTPHEATRIDPDPNLDKSYQDAEDIFLAEYRSRPGGALIDPLFFKFDLDDAKDLSQVDSDSVDLIFTIGYPAAFADYNPEYGPDWETVGLQMVSRWVKFYLDPAERDVWDRPALIPLKMRADQHEPLAQPDGLSGAPVFFIHGGKAPSIGFAGMIVRADTVGGFNMLHARYIRKAVSQHIATPIG